MSADHLLQEEVSQTQWNVRRPPELGSQPPLFFKGKSIDKDTRGICHNKLWASECDNNITVKVDLCRGRHYHYTIDIIDVTLTLRST